MKQYPHVEDYIELLAGYEPNNMFGNAALKFSLARYDVAIIESMATATMWNSQPYTDRQGELALKLIVKYKRQFANQGIDITTVEENPVWRNPLRKIDRSQRVWQEGDAIHVRFPYNQPMIEEIRTYAKTSTGTAKWMHEEKVWRFGLTEQNLCWLVIWGTQHRLDIDSTVSILYEKIIECEQQPYEIKLVKIKDGHTIINAAQSLLDYIETELGGFGSNNVNQLVDYAGILGYTVDDDIQADSVIQQFGLKQNYNIEPIPENLIAVLDYAKTADRFPVLIYHPAGAIGNTLDLAILHEMFKSEEIVHIRLDGQLPSRLTDIEHAKVIYVEKFPQQLLKRVPLLVSFQELLYGSNKQSWLYAAERTIYMCPSKLRKG